MCLNLPSAYPEMLQIHTRSVFAVGLEEHLQYPDSPFFPPSPSLSLNICPSDCHVTHPFNFISLITSTVDSDRHKVSEILGSSKKQKHEAFTSRHMRKDMFGELIKRSTNLLKLSHDLLEPQLSDRRLN